MADRLKEPLKKSDKRNAGALKDRLETPRQGRMPGIFIVRKQQKGSRSVWTGIDGSMLSNFVVKRYVDPTGLNEIRTLVSIKMSGLRP